MLKAFNLVSGLEPSSVRFARGQRSNITLQGASGGINWIRKETNDANESMSWEFRNMVMLMEADLGPNIDEDEGVGGFPEGYEMQLIDSAATVRDYLDATAMGLLNAEVMVDLGQAVGKLLYTLWYTENWVHGDLHLRNIVIDYDRHQGWRPYIIDVSHGYRDTNADREEFADRQQLIVEELNTVDDEVQWFFSNRLDTDWALAFEDRKLGAVDFENVAYRAFVTALEAML